MPKIEFYLLPSGNYSNITEDDLLHLQNLTDDLKKTDLFVVPGEIWEIADCNGITISDFLFELPQSTLTDYLLEIVTKSKRTDMTYDDIEDDVLHGYVVISKSDIKPDKEKVTAYRYEDINYDTYIKVKDVVQVKRYYIKRIDNYNDYKLWASDCFPQLIFHEDAFKHVAKIGKCHDSNEELTRHLIVLNDVGATSYQYYNGNEKDIMAEFESGYNVICSGKGSNEEKTFNKNINWQGTIYNLTCNPHTKLYQSNNDKRIYFCWGRDEIDNHKIIIVRIGNHWD
jgi:hypothetical protein